MSVMRLVEVSCDGPDDATDCPESRGWNAAGTAAALRARMRGDGWLCAGPGGVDRCRDCRNHAKEK